MGIAYAFGMRADKWYKKMSGHREQHRIAKDMYTITERKHTREEVIPNI